MNAEKWTSLAVFVTEESRLLNFSLEKSRLFHKVPDSDLYSFQICNLHKISDF